MKENLEVLVAVHAMKMADNVLAASKEAESEEDIRHECNRHIDAFIKAAGLKIKGKHETRLAGGRIDSKYGAVFIEYKFPKGASRITERRNSTGFKAVSAQITKRLVDFNRTGPDSGELLGVGCDGNTILFVQGHGEDLDIGDPQPITPYTVERLLRALVSVAAQGRSFTPETLANVFGSDGEIAQNGIRLLHSAIQSTDNPKARMFLQQWQILFGEVCGYDIHDRNEKIRKLSEHYGIRAARPADLLFAVHTYYAIFMKLLATEIASSFSPLVTSPLRKLASASSSRKLREELRNIEEGGIWSQLGLRNFLEGDIFSWYLEAWNQDCTQAIRSMIQSFDEFDPSTLSVEPLESRDLLKQLYQELFPKSVRHDLGEYYTPDWLADLVLDELGYDGNPDERLLDPACGSGTFLVMALNRVKRWYHEHRYECGFGERELLDKILKNIIGFDLNPLAVMAARTNYLLAIGEMLRQAPEVELPVYLCDSIMTPSDYPNLFGNARKLKTSGGEFSVPAEVTQDRNHLTCYANLIEACIRDGYSADDFMERCRGEDFPFTETTLHKELYSQLQTLETQNQNGIWTRIIKNAFAPLFISKVNYVVGNPPWVNWEHLPDDYRNSMKSLWQEYGLFSLSGSAGRLGGGKKDLSMLFTYSSFDNYLEPGGRLGFLITQSVFKTEGAGDGFRQFEYKDRESQLWYLKPLVVHDLSAMQVFEGAANRTSLFVCEKTPRPFRYPVNYTTWKGKSRVAQTETLSQVRKSTVRTKLLAMPVLAGKPSSPWLTAPKQVISPVRKVLGTSEYRAHEGVNTGGLNGCFWIRPLKDLPRGDLLIENLHDVGKIKVNHVQTVIEADRVYGLIRGRDVQRWQADPSTHIILAQDPTTKKGVPEDEMRVHWPKTYSYLKRFEGDRQQPERGTLRGRALYRRYFKPTDPFYSMYGVGSYSLSSYRVVWGGQVATELNASVSGSDETARPILNDQTAYFVPFDGEGEAHYFAALLNSAPIRLYYKCLAYKHTSLDFIRNLAIERYQPRKDTRHGVLSQLSKKCHDAVRREQRDAVHPIEVEIDGISAEMWGITNAELGAIHTALDST